MPLYIFNWWRYEGDGNTVLDLCRLTAGYRTVMKSMKLKMFKPFIKISYFYEKYISLIIGIFMQNTISKQIRLQVSDRCST